MNASDFARENAKLRKINEVLMRRVESNAELDASSPFGVFQTAVLLEASIRARTAELSRLNASLRDEIDARTQIIDALESAKRAAEGANAVKTRFLAAISHDLMQPLSAARLFLDSLAERGHDAPTLALLQNIDASLASVDHLLGSLLELARLDVAAPSVVPRAFSMRRFLDDIVAPYRAEAAHRGLGFCTIGADAIVYTDPALLERIVRNLLSNALRYTPRGRIAVVTRVRRTGLRLEVRDSGIGIPADRLVEIFEEFKQLDATTHAEGYGLGLSIVDRIARLLGLSLEVRSHAGAGSVFSVELPIAQARDADPSPAQNAAAQPFFGKSAVVLGSDAAVARTLGTLFAQWGGRAFTATNDVELEHALGACPSPDVLLLDDDARLFGTLGTLRARIARDVPALLVANDPSADARSAATAHNAYLLARPVHAARLRSLLLHVFPR
ncbi:MAG TPA: HAMP domain-containing sensor histidine kinase [Candidatus Aquilonibacter sp.]